MSTQDSAQLDPLADTLADDFDDDWDVAPPPRRRTPLDDRSPHRRPHHRRGLRRRHLRPEALGRIGIDRPQVAERRQPPRRLPRRSNRRRGGLPTGLTQGGFGGGTRGTVSYIDGNILYVSTGTGSVVKVSIPNGLTVDRTVTAKASSIRPGETVVVQGTAATNGTVKATGVTVTAP